MATNLDRGGRRPAVRLLLLVCLQLAALPAAAAKWKDPTPAEKQIVEDASKGLVGAVYLEKESESLGDRYRVYVRAKILSTTGYDVATVDSIAQDARAIEGRTVGPTGKVTELAKKDVMSRTVLKAAGWTIKRKGFTMPALEPGCFIEYSYEEPGAFGSESGFHTEILFQDRYPVLRQEVRTPRQFPFSSTMRNMKGVQIKLSEEGNRFLYSASDAPAVVVEPYGLPPGERAASLVFGYVFSEIGGVGPEEYWAKVTELALAETVSSEMAKPSKLQKVLAGIPPATDPAERIGGLYRWVQTNIKNREVLKAGETEPRGGWKPNDDAADTLSRGSGTSADLTILFLSLLRADGWKSRVVYTADREYRYFRPEIPSVFQLSGIVVEISDARLKNPMYASFEHPMLPFGLLPWNRIGVTGWAVDLEKKSGTAQPIPGPPAEQSAVHTVWKIRMDENGDGRVERARRMSGLRAFEIRAPIWSEGLDTWEKQAREGYPKDPIPGELESLRFENLEAPEKELLDTAISMRKGLGASLPGFRLTVTPVRLAAMRNVFVKSSRDESIQFPFPFVYEDAFEIEAPEGFAPDTLPDPAERKTAAGIYRISAEKGEGARITVRRRFELLRPSGGREMYGAFRTLFETAEREDEGYTVVFRKPAPAGGKKP